MILIMYLFGGTVQPGSFQRSPEAAGTDGAQAIPPAPAARLSPAVPQPWPRAWGAPWGCPKATWMWGWAPCLWILLGQGGNAKVLGHLGQPGALRYAGSRLPKRPIPLANGGGNLPVGPPWKWREI